MNTPIMYNGLVIGAIESVEMDAYGLKVHGRMIDGSSFDSYDQFDDERTADLVRMEQTIPTKHRSKR